MPDVLSRASPAPAAGPCDEDRHDGGPHVISSAVVTAKPAHVDAVCRSIAEMDGTEVCASEGSKIVIVLEADRRHAVGEMLTRVALIDGVISANMVFEHVDDEEDSA